MDVSEIQSLCPVITIASIQATVQIRLSVCPSVFFFPSHFSKTYLHDWDSQQATPPPPPPPFP